MKAKMSGGLRQIAYKQAEILDRAWGRLAGLEAMGKGLAGILQ